MDHSPPTPAEGRLTPGPEWTEEDSAVYREIAAVAVPDRAEQVACVAALAPFEESAAFRIVELACGEGLHAATLLRTFPHASYVGLDGSSSMLREAANRLREFGDRVELLPFDLASDAWHGVLEGAGLVFSSLCIHHIPAEGKRELFRSVHARLAPGGAFLIADLVHPQHPRVGQMFADAWDRKVAFAGEERLRQFEAAKWNHYRHPDGMDRPSPMYHQLRWLDEAGFTAVDCFWMQAGHAIFGGYKAPVP